MNEILWRVGCLERYARAVESIVPQLTSASLPHAQIASEIKGTPSTKVLGGKDRCVTLGQI